jgi:threonine dehydrogenase-like Zn-dependent dehydrogenase
MNRKKFITSCSVVGAAAVMAPSVAGSGILGSVGNGKIKVAIIGCGSVSGVYLPHLTKSPYVELVSVCDIKPERANARAEQFGVPFQYPHIDQLLAGAGFDLMINLTNMQEHDRWPIRTGKGWNSCSWLKSRVSASGGHRP